LEMLRNTSLSASPQRRHYRMPTVNHFQPYKVETGARERGCFTCTHFQGQFFCEHVVCVKCSRPAYQGLR